MAASITVQILLDGPRDLVLLINGTNGASGGAGGADLPYTIFANPSSFAPMDDPRKQYANNFRIMKVEWDINAEAGFDVQLLWDGSPSALALNSVARKTDTFTDFGGLTRPNSITAPTGRLGIQTTGASASAVNNYSIILRLVKTANL